jgi:hypothetical protein
MITRLSFLLKSSSKLAFALLYSAANKRTKMPLGDVQLTRKSLWRDQNQTKEKKENSNGK